jgi:MFS family permease
VTRTRALLLLALAEFLAMSLWFAASAVSPQIAREWHLDAASTAWLTLAVQLGFVAGTLISAIFNIPDVFTTRHVFAASALCGAVANFLMATMSRGATSAIALRFITGLFLAGVYPPGMKLIATWFREGRGLALGVLVGALTLGKASPYLINALGSSRWRTNVAFTSLLALAASAIVAFSVREGPFALPRQPFDVSQVTAVFSNRGVRLANFGYFGHMWELYAMWTWVPAMLRASFVLSGDRPLLADAGSFIVIGSGAIGCVVAGRLADRLGRANIASGAMAISGTCCVVIGFLYGGPAIALLVVAAIWGASVVADSAQFSACVTELADPRYIGTALTMQTCIGFLITTLSIRLMPLVVTAAGWRLAFIALAPGPFLGIVAMMRLKRVSRESRGSRGSRES